MLLGTSMSTIQGKLLHKVPQNNIPKEIAWNLQGYTAPDAIFLIDGVSNEEVHMQCSAECSSLAAAELVKWLR